MTLVPHSEQHGHREKKIQHLSGACVLHINHTGNYLRLLWHLQI